MAMVVGVDVVVDNDEVVTAGTGLKRTLYDADVATISLPTLPTLGSTAAPWNTQRPVSQDDIDRVKEARVRVLQDAARRANAYGGALVTYIQTNAKAVVSTSDSTQRMPASTAEDTPTKAPASNVELSIV